MNCMDAIESKSYVIKTTFMVRDSRNLCEIWLITPIKAIKAGNTLVRKRSIRKRNHIIRFFSEKRLFEKIIIPFS